MNELLKLPNRKIKSINGNPEKAAKAARLVYIQHAEAGIQRVRHGKSFTYVDEKNKVIRHKTVLQRIHSLKIPPAWADVWICPLENGHLQATGYDVRKRKQYLYHPLWHALRNQTKYYRLIQFGHALPGIRAQVNADLALKGLPVEKVLAIVISLMEQTNIRVGSHLYEKLNGSFGLTTLKDNHVHISGSKLQFAFKGKKGIYHDVTIKSKRLAKMVKACMDIPGKELFQYYAEDGSRRSIDSGMVNEYIKKITGEEFTSKDFRTWSGTILAYQAMKEIIASDKKEESKKNVVAVLNAVSKSLGNTRSVCKKYYVHPVLMSLYEAGELDKYLSSSSPEKMNDSDVDLSSDEKVVLKILESKS